MKNPSKTDNSAVRLIFHRSNTLFGFNGFSVKTRIIQEDVLKFFISFIILDNCRFLRKPLNKYYYINENNNYQLIS